MIVVDDKHTAGDISRLLRTLSTYLVFFGLGFFIAYYYFNGEQKVIPYTCNCVVTCDSPALEVKSYLVTPIKMPKTGVDGAWNH